MGAGCSTSRPQGCGCGARVVSVPAKVLSCRSTYHLHEPPQFVHLQHTQQITSVRRARISKDDDFHRSKMVILRYVLVRPSGAPSSQYLGSSLFLAIISDNLWQLIMFFTAMPHVNNGE
ncbi:hypothetical protein IG631_07000 [Alternaria alternata]|nr:hypothetical protein IG631_07000 [Alternaria alternata]